ncbi:MAG: hypothetical protein ACO3EZ_17840 [Prochlorotrichaceae cyanobacterium]
MQVYTTNQLSELLGSSPSTLRSQKQRNPDLFVEGEAFVRDEHGALLWTMPGSIAMAQLLNTDDSLAWLDSLPNVTSLSTEELPTATVPPTTVPELDEALHPLNTAAEAVAWQLIQQHFHQRVGDSIRRILYQPSPPQQEYLDRMMTNYGLATGWMKVMDTVQGAIETSSRERRAIAVLQAGDDFTSS